MKCSGGACSRRKQMHPWKALEEKALGADCLQVGLSPVVSGPRTERCSASFTSSPCWYSPSFTRYLSNLQICLHFLPSGPCLRPCYIAWLPQPVHTLSSFFPNFPPLSNLFALIWDWLSPTQSHRTQAQVFRIISGPRPKALRWLSRLLFSQTFDAELFSGYSVARICLDFFFSLHHLLPWFNLGMPSSPCQWKS